MGRELDGLRLSARLGQGMYRSAEHNGLSGPLREPRLEDSCDNEGIAGSNSLSMATS